MSAGGNAGGGSNNTNTIRIEEVKPHPVMETLSGVAFCINSNPPLCLSSFSTFFLPRIDSWAVSKGIQQGRSTQRVKGRSHFNGYQGAGSITGRLINGSWCKRQDRFGSDSYRNWLRTKFCHIFFIFLIIIYIARSTQPAIKQNKKNLL